MDFSLIRLQSDGKTASAPITREHTLIGRQTGCHLRIRSGEVSPIEQLHLPHWNLQP